MNAPDSKYLELARKLKRLADESSFDGERESAKARLDELMKKRGITIAEMEFIDLDWHEFRFKRHEKWLFMQVVLSVCGREVRNRRLPRSSSIDFYISKSDALEIELKFDHYKRVFDKEHEILRIAFVQKHRLFSEESSNDSKSEELDFETLMKIKSTMRNLQTADFVKQLK